jgi:hypothetical protein
MMATQKNDALHPRCNHFAIAVVRLRNGLPTSRALNTRKKYLSLYKIADMVDKERLERQEPELIQPKKLPTTAIEDLEGRIRMGGDVAMQAYRELLRRARYGAFLEERQALLYAPFSYAIAAKNRRGTFDL